jgi:hypothetical protein
MTNLLKLASCALVIAASAVPTFAQDSSSSSSSSEMSSAMSSTSSAASSSETATVNYDQVIAEFEAGNPADISSINASSTINIVLVSDLKANGDAKKVDAIIAKIGDAAAILKANVETNATLSDKVVAAGFTADLVLAVLRNDDGSFTVIINDQHP